ncbi:hypothetical protein OKW21_004557 [Catalinimonas alkaloidigena]|uniref:alginate lyase family protein n=1 Tax=Catalinimonas alkaloidigena TaxID=1075417 RepID=UPI0024056391|nr:alginate lyase family protein [Catalinimonas alkaloidigena]MDF9799294.1 hypothetical protein [Catalinimonas alkaloidigena]
MIRINRFVFVLFVLALLGGEGYATHFIRLDSSRLARVKQSLQNGTASARTRLAYEELIKDADHLLTIENPSVVDKSIAPPTGDKHDYLSISRYWWPDPESPDGLPWIRKDGETNPDTQTDAVDRKRLSLMTNGVQRLSLAYYFSGNEQYAKKATNMIKTWFLDDDTRMNPHLEFAQSVPGNPRRRPFGILDGRSIIMNVPDAIEILSDSPHWTNSHHRKMSKWFNDYLAWLTESDLGKQGMELDNNHGSWYKYQVAALALYLGKEPLVRRMVEMAQQSLEQQLNEQGGQIHELERTRSFFYSCFNLEALTSIATLADQVGINMWHFTTSEGKSLKLAINYLTPVVSGEDWPYPSKQGVNLSYLVPLLIRVPEKETSNEFDQLLFSAISILEEQERTTGEKNEVLQELSLLKGIND